MQADARSKAPTSGIGGLYNGHETGAAVSRKGDINTPWEVIAAAPVSCSVPLFTTLLLSFMETVTNTNSSQKTDAPRRRRFKSILVSLVIFFIGTTVVLNLPQS